MSSDPDRPCAHEDFEASIEVNRLTSADDGPVIAFAAEVRVWCTVCDEPFRFTGLPAGLLPDRPTVDPAETTLRVPIRPASSDPDFGMGLPGFAVRYRDG